MVAALAWAALGLLVGYFAYRQMRAAHEVTDHTRAGQVRAWLLLLLGIGMGAACWLLLLLATNAELRTS